MFNITLTTKYKNLAACNIRFIGDEYLYIAVSKKNERFEFFIMFYFLVKISISFMDVTHKQLLCILRRFNVS